MRAANFSRTVVIAILFLSGLTRPAQAALNYYVHIPAIRGEATALHHEGWIEALSFSAGVSNPAMVKPGGVIAGAASLSSIFVMKPVDRASPTLARVTATGAPLGTVTLDVVESASGLPVYHIILRNAVVSSSTLSGSTAELPTETLSIEFEAIEWTYTYQTGSAELMSHWDRITVMGGPGPLPTPVPVMQPDSDGDGIPDEYELANGLNPMVMDAHEDKDGDGASNLSEYRAGTRANDATSVFRVRGVSRNNSTIIITWSSVGNKTYSISKGPAPDGPFTKVQSGIPVFEGETSRPVPMTGTSLFFRVTTP